MPEIKCTVSAQVVGGPQMSVSQVINVQAYDSIQVKVPKSQGTDVAIQPSDEAGQVKVLLIRADRYKGLSYKADSPGADWIALDAPQLMVGPGGVGLLSKTPPKTLTFKNTQDDEASIHILVGRDAILPE